MLRAALLMFCASPQTAARESCCEWCFTPREGAVPREAGHMTVRPQCQSSDSAWDPFTAPAAATRDRAPQKKRKGENSGDAGTGAAAGTGSLRRMRKRSSVSVTERTQRVKRLQPTQQRLHHTGSQRDTTHHTGRQRDTRSKPSSLAPFFGVANPMAVSAKPLNSVPTPPARTVCRRQSSTPV